MQLCAILSALLFAAGVSADTKLEEIEARLRKLEMENTKVLAQNRALHLQMDVIRKSEKQLKLQQEGLLSRLEDVEMKQNNETVVAFSIYRTIDYDLLDSVIPYQAEHLNIGGAIDTRVGVFTAPVAGVYLFTAHNLGGQSDITLVSLRKNGVRVSSTYAYMDFGNSIAQTVLLELEAGDQVDSYLDGGYAHTDRTYIYSQFSGVLLSAL